jgi:hypothetical protein
MSANGIQDNEPQAEPEVDQTPEPTGDEGGAGWAEKKAERYEHWTHKKEAERQKLASQLQQEREARQKDAEERHRQAVELAELRGRMAAAEEYKRQQQAQKPDTYDTELADLNRQAMEAYASNDWDRGRKIDEKVWRMAARREAAAYIKENQPQAPDPAQYILAAEFPWLQSNQSARMAADGWINILQAQGKPPGIETYREACRKAAEAMGLSKPNLPATTNAQRQLYGGTPPSRDVGGGQQGAYELNDAEKSMARRAAAAAGLHSEQDIARFMESFKARRAASSNGER